MADARDLATIVGNIIVNSGRQVEGEFAQKVDQSVEVINQELHGVEELDEEGAMMMGDNLILMVWCPELGEVVDVPGMEEDPRVEEFHTLRDAVIDAVCEFYGIETAGEAEGEEGVDEDEEEDYAAE